MPVVFQNELSPFISGPIHQIGGAADELLRGYEMETQRYMAELQAGLSMGQALGGGLGAIAQPMAASWARDNRLDNAEAEVRGSNWSPEVQESALRQITAQRYAPLGRPGGPINIGQDPWTVQDTINSAMKIPTPLANAGMIGYQTSRGGDVRFSDPTQPFSFGRGGYGQQPYTAAEAADSAVTRDGRVYYNTDWNSVAMRELDEPQTQTRPPTFSQLYRMYDDANQGRQKLGVDADTMAPIYGDPMPFEQWVGPVLQSYAAYQGMLGGGGGTHPPADLAPGALPGKSDEQRKAAPQVAPGVTDTPAVGTTSGQDSGVAGQAATAQVTDQDRNEFNRMLAEIERTGRKPEGYDELKRKMVGNSKR